jgi:two-component system, cell cycle response regulator
VRVLIAESDARSRQIFENAVKELGHECLLASDGLEAWELYRNTSGVDVVISDRTMPGIDGPELYRRVRGIDPRQGELLHLPLGARKRVAPAGC